MDGGRTTTRQYSDFVSTQREPEYIKIQTYISGSPLRSDGVDETGDANRILV